MFLIATQFVQVDRSSDSTGERVEWPVCFLKWKILNRTFYFCKCFNHFNCTIHHPTNEKYNKMVNSLIQVVSLSKIIFITRRNPNLQFLLNYVPIQGKTCYSENSPQRNNKLQISYIIIYYRYRKAIVKQHYNS